MKIYEGNKPYVFVSYAHRDASRVLPIIEAMSDAGIRVWYDSGVGGGKDKRQYVATRIAGCFSFLAFVTKNYISSGDCRYELTSALNGHKYALTAYLEEVVVPSWFKLQLEGVRQVPGIAWPVKKKEKHVVEIACKKVEIEVDADEPEPPEIKLTPASELAVDDILSAPEFLLCREGDMGNDPDAAAPDPAALERAESKYCRNCGERAASDDVFCSKCGSNAFARIYQSNAGCDGLKYCFFCGATESEDANYCTECGRNVFTDSRAEFVRMQMEECLNCSLIEGDRLVRYHGRSENVYIPSGIKAIEACAFSSNDRIRTVILPEETAEIGGCAFAFCSSLEKIVIPAGVKDMGDRVFIGCPSLEICCVSDSQPDTWNENWNPDGLKIVWGYKE